MAIYSGSYQITGPVILTTPATSIFTPIIDVATKSSTGRVCVLEACIQVTTFVNTSTSATLGISRSTNTPVQTGQTYLTPENPSDSQSLTSFATTWSVAPTVGATIRRVGFNSTISSWGVLFSFQKGYNISPTNSIVISYIAAAAAGNIWNTSANALNGYFLVNE